MGESVGYKGIQGNWGGGALTKLFCILVVMVVTQLHAFVKIGRNEHESRGGGGGNCTVFKLNFK